MHFSNGRSREAPRRAGEKRCVERSSARLREASRVRRSDPEPDLRTRVLVSRSRGDREGLRSEEHTSELQSLMRISYAVFCLKKKKKEMTRSTSRQFIEQLK